MPSADELVGRGAELASIQAEVVRLSEGRAAVLAIEGEAGIGKTRLVQSIVDDARSRGMAVFCGRGHPFERTRPFGVVAAALGVSTRSPDPRSAAIGALLAGQERRGAGRRRRHPVPGRRGDGRPGGDGVRRAPGAAGRRGHPLGRHREPVDDLVDRAAAAARSPARRGDHPAVAAPGRGGPAARRPGGRRRAHPAPTTAEVRRRRGPRLPSCSGRLPVPA